MGAVGMQARVSLAMKPTERTLSSLARATSSLIPSASVTSDTRYVTLSSLISDASLLSLSYRRLKMRRAAPMHGYGDAGENGRF